MIAPHPQNTRNYGPMALLCTHIAFPYTTRELESIKRTWAETLEMNAKVELVLNFIVDNKSRSFFDT